MFLNLYLIMFFLRFSHFGRHFTIKLTHTMGFIRKKAKSYVSRKTEVQIQKLIFLMPAAVIWD